jgi:CheY-like chemotaxis protein
MHVAHSQGTRGEVDPTRCATVEYQSTLTAPLEHAKPVTTIKPPGVKILCVEDEPSLRRSLVRMLGIGGHQVLGVESAEQAIEMLEVNTFDLVLSDVSLPGMSGEQLRRTILDRYPNLGERVLLMSGFFPNHQDIPYFLQKPFSLRQLNAALEAVLPPAPSAAAE